MSYQYLLIICIILISTKVFGIFTGKMHLPQVVGALVAGLILGPAGFDMVHSSDLLEQLAELGVIVIMFSAGMETNLKELKQSGRASAVVAILGVIVPLGLGTLLMTFFNPGGNILHNIFIGTILTATSVSITVETLKEMGKLSTKVGNTILGAALLDDILGLVCLTVVTGLGGDDVNILAVLLKILLFFVFALVVGLIYKKIMVWYETIVHERNLHRFPILAFALCLFMAWAAEVWFGVADIIGAFFVGLAVANSPKGSYISSKFAPMSYLLLTPIFFANIGLSIELPPMSSQIILFTVLFVAVGILSKLIGCGIGAKACGYSRREAVQIGFGMACRGEVALIVANKGLSTGLVPQEFFGPIIVMVVCCAVFTPILLKLAFRGENAYQGLSQSPLVDGYELTGQLDIVANRLIDQDKEKKQKLSQ